MNLRRTAATAGGLALALVAAISGVRALDTSGSTRITAYFERATGVYAGSDLRVLGVKVGTVDRVRPDGDRVELTLRVDEGVTVPADARAVVVAPSVVADRYVQLAPAYTGGPALRDGAVLPAERNALPLEVDQLYASITELATALGPGGANAQGALAGLLDTAAANLDGNGKAIGDSVDQFAKAARTLDGSSDDLFEALARLRSFTAMLKENDGNVARAERQLADVTGFLADDKENLGAALKELGTALGQVKGFIQRNRGALKENVDALAPLTRTLVEQRASLAEALDTAPLAAGNALRAYDPLHRTLNGRANINELSFGPEITVPAEVGGPAGLVPVAGSHRRALPAVPLPAVGTVYGTPGQNRSAPPGTAPSGTPAAREGEHR
ncbi:MCE family protein [Streptomyces sp. C10-9-1]|uniref:MCE family protein n=1 Tax=Streptomyces sp. C10-9-1 TaxID=1859285 RepID=UPI003F4A4F65